MGLRGRDFSAQASGTQVGSAIVACLAVPGTASFEVPFLGAGLAEVFNACSFQTNCPRLSEKISAGLGMVF